MVIYWFISALLEDINGKYERLVIQTDINICPSTYWNGFGKENWRAETHVKTNFSAGYFILGYINFLERILISRGIERLSYYLDDRNNPSAHDPEKGIKILSSKNLIQNEKIVSIISDAGTPCISDPGSILVNECIRKELNIYSIPGPSSVTSAVSISGFSDKFIFYGFLEEKKNKLIKELEFLSKIDYSIVIFIPPKKLIKNLENIINFFSNTLR